MQVVFNAFQDWEILVLHKLRWDLSAITPHDFIEQILTRLPVDKQKQNTIKRHAQTFIALTSTGKHSILSFITASWNRRSVQ